MPAAGRWPNNWDGKLNRSVKYALLSLLWAAVAAYIVYAVSAAYDRRRAKIVSRLVIDVTDSSSLGHLVSSHQVREWIARSGIPTLGAKVTEVNLSGIEELIARNGFVDEVNAYVSYGGELFIDISQRRPVLRLLTDGMNAYVTSHGYVFAAPARSSLYVPVVTGSFRPPFPTSYMGFVQDYMMAERRKSDERIAELEREKYPFYKRERDNDENMRALRRMRIKKRWFEKEEAFDKRVRELREKKEELRRRYRYEERLIAEGIARIEVRQEAERVKQKKMEKSCEDFSKLITFVKFVEADDFWRSEVVQIVVSTSVSGSLEVKLVPRSGSHEVLFGRIEQVERKFDKLLRFYRNGLEHLGWDRYRTVDVRYAGQVVCKK